MYRPLEDRSRWTIRCQKVEVEPLRPSLVSVAHSKTTHGHGSDVERLAVGWAVGWTTCVRKDCLRHSGWIDRWFLRSRV